MDGIKPLQIQFDIERLLLEYDILVKSEKPYSDPNGKKSSTWYTIRLEDMTSEYCNQLTNNIKKEYNIKGRADPRFYRLKANSLLPWHIDRGTQCSINVILSDTYAPVHFKINNKILKYNYTVALLNTQIEHSVPSFDKDRLLFKISIFDETFDSVASKIN